MTRLRDVLQRWWAEHSVPVTVFAVTRVGLFVLAYLALIFLPMNTGFAWFWQARPDNLLVDGWTRWDAGWYWRIATEGYANLPRNDAGHTDPAFFPLYPLAIRVVNWVIHEPFVSGLLVSNVALLLALVVLHRLVRERHGPDVARRSVVLLAVFPFAFYFNAMYSESLFLLAVVCTFYFGKRKRWLLASLSAAAAGATRSLGTLALLGLLVLYLEQIRFDLRKIRPDILWLTLGLLGIGGYMAFLALRFGDPWLFYTSQMQPGRMFSAAGTGGGVATTIELIRQTPLSLHAIAAGQFPALEWTHLLVWVLALILAILTWRRLPVSQAAWATLMVLAYVTGIAGMGRYVIPIFPLFVTAALLLRKERLYQTVVYISILLLALFTIMFVLFYWVA